jgi:DNA-binding transcriptional regulator GbsR (MarR family)
LYSIHTADSLEAIEDRILATLGTLGADLGISRAVAQIYGLLYMSDEALSLDDMAARLGLSKATISVNVRSLERWGAVHRTWKEGSRKDWYEPNRDTLHVIWSTLRDGLQRRIAFVQGPLEDLEVGLRRLERSADEPEERRRLKRARAKVEDIRKMESRIRKLLATPDWLRKLLVRGS